MNAKIDPYRQETGPGQGVESSGVVFRGALKNNQVPYQLLEEMAVLTGMKLGDRLSAGTMIKVVSRSSVR